MNNLESNLTIFMIAYFSNYNIEKVIKQISKNIKIIIIENSNLYQTKIYFEKKYSNINVILSEKNLGVSAANNKAFKNINTKYALYLDMDVDFDVKIIQKFIEKADQIDNLALLVPQHQKLRYPKTWRYIPTEETNELIRMKMVHGHFALYSVEAVKDIGYFDEKIFFYYDETDFCLRAIKKNYKIYLMKNINVNHTGNNSYDYETQKNIEAVRQWHLMWGKFYFNKKHFGNLRAYQIIIPDIIGSCMKLIYFYFINKKKFFIYKNRLSVIVNSILGKKSWKRQE